MLAARLPSILPPLTPRELLEVSMIASVAGALPEGVLTDRRPYRAPHHSASMAALVGGGIRARPGEISLAHHGVLFLDELPEFNMAVLDSLRQPLETGDVMIARANVRVTYPARFQLVAAMNPCRCGAAGTPGFTCRRGERCAADYMARLSGPLLDRFDLTVEVPAVNAVDLLAPSAKPESSAAVAARVARARSVQSARYLEFGRPEGATNAAAPSAWFEGELGPDAAGRRLLREAADALGLTARGLYRVLKVARNHRRSGRVHDGRTDARRRGARLSLPPRGSAEGGVIGHHRG